MAELTVAADVVTTGSAGFDGVAGFPISGVGCWGGWAKVVAVEVGAAKNINNNRFD